MRWIRPSIVVLLILTAIVGFFKGLFSGEFMSSLITGMAVWWFRSRDAEKESSKSNNEERLK